MSNPYASLLSSSKVPRPGQDVPSQPQAKDPRSAAPGKPLSQAVKRKQLEKPPNIRFAVRPRYRFDVPEPPMDPKMLLGTLSTASYAKPFLSEIEKDFRLTAVPADPTFGLHANLVDTSIYVVDADLNNDDDALLHSIMAGRKGGHMLNKPESGRNSLKTGAAHARTSSPIMAAPWMRRMSYDEYIARDSAAARQSLISKGEAAKKLAQGKMNDPEVQRRRLRSLLQSFDTVKRNLKHPDIRKGQLRPVSVSPILPDFSAIGEELLALEFDKDAVLTLPSRRDEESGAAEESLRSTATVSVADSRAGDQERKYAVVYTPTNKTLGGRRRKREESEGEEGEEGEGSGEKKLKKNHFMDEEMYQWIGEYSIREGKFGESAGTGGLSRSCFAVSEYFGDDKKASVACFTRIGTTWKLSTKSQADGPVRLGKDGLRIIREATLDVTPEGVQREVLSGAAHARAAENSERSARIAILEED